MPNITQTGSLVLKNNGMTEPTGAWLPNWRHDSICVDPGLSEEIRSEFDLELREVEIRGQVREKLAFQIVPAISKQPWFRPEELTSVLSEAHGVAGRDCGQCQRWRWMPLDSKHLPKPNIESSSGLSLAASPEFFGDGRKSFRLLAIDPRLAELIVSRSPGDFLVRSWHHPAGE